MSTKVKHVASRYLQPSTAKPNPRQEKSETIANTLPASIKPSTTSNVRKATTSAQTKPGRAKPPAMTGDDPALGKPKPLSAPGAKGTRVTPASKDVTKRASNLAIQSTARRRVPSIHEPMHAVLPVAAEPNLREERHSVPMNDSTQPKRDADSKIADKRKLLSSKTGMETRKQTSTTKSVGGSTPAIQLRERPEASAALAPSPESKKSMNSTSIATVGNDISPVSMGAIYSNSPDPSIGNPSEQDSKLKFDPIERINSAASSITKRGDSCSVQSRTLEGVSDFLPSGTESKRIDHFGEREARKNYPPASFLKQLSDELPFLFSGLSMTGSHETDAFVNKSKFLQWKYLELRAEAAFRRRKAEAERQLWDGWKCVQGLKSQCYSIQSELAEREGLSKELDHLTEMESSLSQIWTDVRQSEKAYLEMAQALRLSVTRLPLFGISVSDTATLNNALAAANQQVSALMKTEKDFFDQLRNLSNTLSELTPLISRTAAVLTDSASDYEAVARLFIKETSYAIEKEQKAQMNQR